VPKWAIVDGAVFAADRLSDMKIADDAIESFSHSPRVNYCFGVVSGRRAWTSGVDR